VSEITGELARVRESFDKPTLRLLDRKWAPFVLATFKSAFSRDRRSVQADRLHVQVDAYLADLRSSGIETPKGAGRSLCLQWVNDQWLYRETGDDDDEQYSLTSHALEALALVESLSSDRALISESRLTTIVDAVRHRAMQADPDREERIRRLDLQVAELTRERDRLAAGGEVEATSDEQMLEGYADLVDLIGRLPSDFKRVEESVAAMHRQIVNDFRGEERPISEVLDEYLAKTDALMSSTAAGRAFEGAFALLRDDALLLDLKNDLQAILDHPFAGAIKPSEQRSFLATVGLIRKGIDDVLVQRNGLTTTLREHIVNHDVVKDRELERLLRDINRELATWMETAGPRSSVTAPLLPATLDVEHLRERFYDPQAHLPPRPLEDVSEDAPEPPSLADMRKQGGPLVSELQLALAAALESGSAGSVGEVFNALEPLRRPVEILGLLQLAAQVQALEGTESTESTPGAAGTEGIEGTDAGELFQTVRPDGTTRTFAVPRIALPARGRASAAPASAATPTDGASID
jgi:hypothetical protein